jgi:outer membrane receptor protein involved in Fe transport
VAAGSPGPFDRNTPSGRAASTSSAGVVAGTTCTSCLSPTLRYLSFDDQVGYFDHHRWEPQYRFEDSFSWHKGRHDLKFGGLYNWASHTVISNDAENGIFGFPSNTYFDPTRPSTYPERLTIRVSPQNSANGYHWIAAYAQDKWQAVENLTLTLGLRYDRFIMKTPNQFNPLFADRSSNGANESKDFGPRLGFAYGSRDGRAVLRGGFGVSFQAPSVSTYIDNYYRLGVYGTGLVVTFPSSGVADPGPSTGRLPTDPMLLSIGPDGPVVNRALLNQIYPPGTLIRNTNTVFLDNPDRRIARVFKSHPDLSQPSTQTPAMLGDSCKDSGC